MPFEVLLTSCRDVLNDDQKKKFDAWQQEMHDRMRQHPGGDVPKYLAQAGQSSSRLGTP